uniref:Uncharacterized protein n=1 Tax=Anguilla anguilla TaxID=7936 RepID=A0A0E9UVH2_ANGAN
MLTQSSLKKCWVQNACFEMRRLNPMCCLRVELLGKTG